MNTELVITKITRADLKGAYEVFEKTVPIAIGGEDSESIEEIKAIINSKKNMVDKAVNDTSIAFFIAKINGKIVATVAYTLCSEDMKISTKNKINNIGEIGSLFVLPEYQGKGIGSILIQYMESYLKERGIEEYSLMSGYKDAQPKWIKKFGKPLITVKDYWGVGVDNMIWVCKID